MHFEITANTCENACPADELNSNGGQNFMQCPGLSANYRDIHFAPIAFTDLGAIVKLYRERRPLTAKGAPQDIGADFGMPMFQAVHHGKVIAYSCYVVNDDQAVLAAYVCRGWERFGIVELLSCYGSEDQAEASSAIGTFNDLAALKNGITRLVDWLNRCV